MKRSPLLRKTPLKRVSDKKRAWRELYVAGLRFLLTLDPLCRKCGVLKATEGHHIFGQGDALILLFRPICRNCHDQIHGSPNAAREEGWLI